MTLQEIQSLPPAERDALVAEKVMGWKLLKYPPNLGEAKGDGYIFSTGLIELFVPGFNEEYFQPSTNASIDYAVLKYFREKYGKENKSYSDYKKMCKLIYYLRGIYCQHETWASYACNDEDMVLAYEVGDWSTAALATVME